MSKTPLSVKARSTALLFISVCFALGQSPAVLSNDRPEVTDDRLEVKLFAEDPEIVTPIGMVIDRDDRIFVIESHTHLTASDYEGPDSDRIKVFVDKDYDGVADQVTVFADGLSQCMNLAFAPDGGLYVVTARSVVRLDDLDRDGKAERQTVVLKLLTKERYAHNSLLSLTFDSQGNLYVGRGNTGSRYYKLQGPDGSYVEGYGDGGSVVTCKSDGTAVREVATGFWNPFDLKFDLEGNLLLVDNDPDARGPNRLLKVVDGGDYGYKSVYGGAGNHPFQGWDGRLPGTLPYISGTGEAPSGLIDLRRANFPSDYDSSVLATIWNENSIECFKLDRSRPNLTCSEKTVLLQGGKEFRPVALDCDSRGNLYVTDWVLVDYPNHGRGRIWRITNKDGASATKPASYFSDKSPNDSLIPAAAMSELQLVATLSSTDAFEVHRARQALAAPAHRGLRKALLKSANPDLAIAAILSSVRAGDSLAFLPNLLKHPSDDVKLAAIMNAAESHDLSFAAPLDRVLESDLGVSSPVAHAWLAAKGILTREFIEAYNSRAQEKSNQLKRTVPEGTTWKLAGNPAFSPKSRAIGIRLLTEQEVIRHSDALMAMVRAADPITSVAALNRLVSASDSDLSARAETLALTLASDGSRDSDFRSAMLDALSHSASNETSKLLPLVLDREVEVALAAATLLQARAPTVAQMSSIDEILKKDLPDRVREQLVFARHGLSTNTPDVSARPSTPADWQTFLAGGGYPKRGKRVFESVRTGCSGCHSIGGFQNQLGPDLGGLAASKTREQVIAAILDPSSDFAPQYQAWVVITVDGQIFRGLQLDHKAGGAIIMTLADGKTRKFEADDIKDYQASPSSLMPNGLQDTMTASEFRDLVAYLMAE